MWFVLGLFTLLGSAVLMHRQRSADRWVGFPSGRLHFEERRHPKTGKILRLFVRIDVDPALEFELKRESWLDRLAKFLGVSREVQVGRDAFDASCYVVSDDVAVRARLRADAQLTDRLRELVEYRVGYRFQRLVCRNGRMRIDLKPLVAKPNSPVTLEWLRSRMEALADAAPNTPLRHSARDPYFARSILILAMSSGLAISGGLHLLRLTLTTSPFTVDLARLWALTLPVAAVLLFLLVAATAGMLARTSRAHLVLMEVLLVGSFGATSTAYTELRDFNIEADSGPVAQLTTTVHDKFERRGRRGRRSYYLVLQDWNGGGGIEKVKVSATTYRQVEQGHPVQIRQRPGALAIRWVEAIDVLR